MVSERYDVIIIPAPAAVRSPIGSRRPRWAFLNRAAEQRDELAAAPFQVLHARLIENEDRRRSGPRRRRRRDDTPAVGHGDRDPT